MELGRSEGTACPLVVETPPTPSALLKTRESGAQLGWTTPPPTQHPLQPPLPLRSIISPVPVIPSLNPSRHCDNCLGAPLNSPPPRPSLT